MALSDRNTTSSDGDVTSRDRDILSPMPYKDQLDFLDSVLRQLNPEYHPPAVSPPNPLFNTTLAPSDEMEQNILSYENRKRKMSHGSFRSAAKPALPRQVARSASCVTRTTRPPNLHNKQARYSRPGSCPEMKSFVECGNCGTSQRASVASRGGKDSVIKDISDERLISVEIKDTESYISDDVFTVLEDSEDYKSVLLTDAKEGSASCYDDRFNINFEISRRFNQYNNSSNGGNGSCESIQRFDEKNSIEAKEFKFSSIVQKENNTKLRLSMKKPAVSIRKQISSKLMSLFRFKKKPRNIYCKISKPSRVAENEYDVIRDPVSGNNDHMTARQISNSQGAEQNIVLSVQQVSLDSTLFRVRNVEIHNFTCFYIV